MGADVKRRGPWLTRSAILLPQEMARIDKKASESNDDGQKEQ